MTFLEECRKRAEEHKREKEGICETCGNLETITESLIGCIAHDKLILPAYPPYHGRVKCPDWKERRKTSEQNKD